MKRHVIFRKFLPYLLCTVLFLSSAGASSVTVYAEEEPGEETVFHVDSNGGQETLPSDDVPMSETDEKGNSGNDDEADNDSPEGTENDKDENSDPPVKSGEETTHTEENAGDTPDNMDEEAEEPGGETKDTEDSAKSTEDGESDDTSDSENTENKEEETSDEDDNASKEEETVIAYTLSEEELALKEDAAANDLAGELGQYNEGEDYTANEVFCFAEDEEQANEIAKLYQGALKRFGNGVAVITLDPEKMTVAEAVALGQDKGNNLPVVEANYIVRVEPEQVEDVISGSSARAFSNGNVSTRQTWEDMFYSNGFDDPYLHPYTDVAESNTWQNTKKYQWMHEKINTYAAWGVAMGEGVTVGVIDTGVFADHEELIGRVEAYEIAGMEANATHVTGSHGTHVAGIIAAAAGNDKGGAGVAPMANILSVNVQTEDEYGASYMTEDNIIRAINYLSGNGKARKVDIINMSLGGPSYSTGMKSACEKAYKAGITVIASMGNETANNRSYPAAFPHVIGVSSINEAGTLSAFSTYGSHADIAAPGSNILSCVSTGISDYENWNGTSMAAPVVSGACALYMSAYGHVSPDKMEQVLKKSVNKSASSQIGAGIIDVSKMFSVDNTPPVVRLKTVSYNEDVIEKTVSTVSGGKTVKYGANVSVIASVEMEAATKLADAEGYNIVYTTDGTQPAVRNGEVTNGTVYEHAIEVGDLIDTNVTKAQRITVRAITVSGMGVVSKASTLVFTADPAMAGNITIHGAPATLVAGKTVKLTASVTPQGASQKVIWSVVQKDDTLKGTSINKNTGELKTAAKQTGRITVRCTTADGFCYADATIDVQQAAPVKEIKFQKASVTMTVTSVKEKETQWVPLYIASIKDSKNRSRFADMTTEEIVKDLNENFRFTSGNAKVVTVKGIVIGDTQPGLLLEPVGKGSTTVTLQALDGSGVKASCKVTVKQLSEDVTVSGQTGVAPGTSATYTANVLPKNANDRTVRWSLSASGEAEDYLATGKAAADKIYIHPTKGTLSVGKKVPTDLEFEVVATAKDGTGIDNLTNNHNMTVTVMPRVAKMQLRAAWGEIGIDPESESAAVYKTTVTKAGNLSGLRLYSKTVSWPEGYQATPKFVLDITSLSSASVVLPSKPVVKSSNAKVIKVTSVEEQYVDGEAHYLATIEAVAKGNVKVTATAPDGSKKNISVNISVLEPVTGISVSGQKAVAPNTKTTFKTGVTPSAASQKTVRWTIDSVDPQAAAKIGSKAGANAVYINPKTGEVTVGKNITADAANPLRFTVTATAQDGTRVAGSAQFEVLPRATRVQIRALTEGYFNQPKTDANGHLTSDRLYFRNVRELSNGIYANYVDETVMTIEATVYAQDTELDMRPVITSSKPNVATVEQFEDTDAQGKTHYYATIRAVAAGTTNITATVPDGSGKKGVTALSVIVPATGLSLAPKGGQESYIAYGKGATLTPVPGALYGKPTITTAKWDFEIWEWAYNEEEDYGYYYKSDYSDAIKNAKLVTLKNGEISVATEKKFRQKGFTGSYKIVVTATTADGTGFRCSWDYYITPPTTYIYVYNSNGYYLSPSYNWWIPRGDSYYCFMYTNGTYDPSSLAVKSSNPQIVSAENYGGYLRLTAGKRGTAYVTITARDGTGKKTTICFISY